jgi:hypothetical protein
MKTAMIAALLALLAGLSGCAASSSQQDVRPYAHFYSATELSSVTLSHGQHVAVLLGHNASATLDYLQRHRDAIEPSAASATPVAPLGHNQAYAWLARSLAQQFAEVTFYDDLDTLLADRPDVIVLLDSQSSLVATGIEASVVARFYDDQLTYIGRAEGIARKHASTQVLAGQLAEEQAVQADALRQFDASLRLLLQKAA